MFGGFGIILSLICLFSLKDTGNNSNTILKSLAFSDATVCIIGIPFSIIRKYHEPMRNDCTAEAFLICINVLGIMTSSLSILLLAIDRYVLLTRKNYRNLMTKKRMVICISSTWTYSLFICSMRFVDTMVFNGLMLLAIITACIGIIVVYILILRFLRLARKSFTKRENEEAGPSNTIVDKKQLVEKKVTKKVILIISIFFITLTPATVYYASEKLIKFKPSIFINHTVAFLMLSNSLINPIIYVAIDRRFRKKFLFKFFSKKRNRIFQQKSKVIALKRKDEMELESFSDGVRTRISHLSSSKEQNERQGRV